MENTPKNNNRSGIRNSYLVILSRNCGALRLTPLLVLWGSTPESQIFPMPSISLGCHKNGRLSDNC
ncbi:hypothetical protein KKJ12_21325, partial [Xenorhabdus bovienii]|uniref:hypothetical protein n=1 Tax=Xenorhabdus bovienii TaxID=40576 RepID=UPI0023B2470F